MAGTETSSSESLGKSSLTATIMETQDQGSSPSADLNSSYAVTPSSLLCSYPCLFNLTSNLSSNLSTQSMPFQGSSTLVTAVISLTVFVVGLTGNTLAIYVVLRYAKMKTVTNIYILNLAVADELYIIGLPFLTTQNVLSYWPFNLFLCRVVMTADSMNQFTSIFCLTVMSIDRYLAVVHPIRSTKWRHPRVAKVVSAGVWAMSFVVVLPVVIFSDVQVQTSADQPMQSVNKLSCCSLRKSSIFLSVQPELHL